MTLQDVEGQDRAIAALQGALCSRTVHHAWLFHGPEGVGKELAAIGLAQALTCPQKPYQGCGTCMSCKRLLDRNHPDVIWVMPQEEMLRRHLVERGDFASTPSRDIRIEQVRQLQKLLSYRAFEAPHKVSLIITAHAMNASAQNALLKTLEEPPPNTILILVSSAPEKLASTVRSRCTKVAFGPLTEALLVGKLKSKWGCDDETAALIAAMAGGSLSRALDFDPQKFARRRSIIERFEGLSPNDARGWLNLAEALGEDRTAAESALEVLQMWLHDLAAIQAGAHKLIHSDLATLAGTAANHISPTAVLRRTALIDEARNAITQRNGSIRLQLERMFVAMFVS